MIGQYGENVGVLNSRVRGDHLSGKVGGQPGNRGGKSGPDERSGARGEEREFQPG